MVRTLVTLRRETPRLMGEKDHDEVVQAEGL